MKNKNLKFINEQVPPDKMDRPDEEDSDSKVSEEPTSKKQNEQIKDIGSIVTKNAKHKICCITIIGEIEGHYLLPEKTKTTKYEHVLPLLVSIEENNEIDGVLILINTVGGDIEAGLALAELIAGMRKPTVSIVLGGGHSIGVPLAVAARKSFIVKSATMTIHPVRFNGLMLGVPQTFEYFNKMQERIINFVTDNSNISKKRFRKLCMNTKELAMDIGTVLEGEDAVNEGLIDSIGSLSDAMNSLYEMIEKAKTNTN